MQKYVGSKYEPRDQNVHHSRFDLVKRLGRCVNIQRNVVLLFLVGFLVISARQGGVSAEVSTQRVTMTPFLQNITVQADQPTKSFTVILTNNAVFAQNFRLSVVDFGNLDETGGLVYAGANSNLLNKKYGLANWLELGQNSVSLEAGKSVEIEGVIKNDVELSPGGHYAALIAEVNPQETQLENTIEIKQKISSLIFVTKTGGEAYNLALNGFTHNGSLMRFPTHIVLDFKNKGNIHVIPRGVVSVKNVSGEVVSRAVINESSSYVLPETSRQIVVDLKKVSSGVLLPGKYRIEVAYRYDGYESMAIYTKTILFISWMVLVIVIILLSSIYLLLRSSALKKLLRKSRK